MELIGISPINRNLVIAGKLGLFPAMLSFFIQPFYNLRMYEITSIIFLSKIIISLGIIITIFSFIGLGKSVRMGLPSNKTKLQTSGIYKFSRNPMYVGFFTLAIGSSLYTLNILIVILGIIGIMIHNKIILAEEKFLENKFGKEYLNYKKQVRRYF